MLRFCISFNIKSYRIDVFPIIFDMRGVGPHATLSLGFHCDACAQLWRHRINTLINTENRGKRSMSVLKTPCIKFDSKNAHWIYKTAIGVARYYAIYSVMSSCSHYHANVYFYLFFQLLHHCLQSSFVCLTRKH